MGRIVLYRQPIGRFGATGVAAQGQQGAQRGVCLGAVGIETLPGDPGGVKQLTSGITYLPPPAFLNCSSILLRLKAPGVWLGG